MARLLLLTGRPGVGKTTVLRCVVDSPQGRSSGIGEAGCCACMPLIHPPRVAADHFLLYLKEVEYRFNRRELYQDAFVNHLLNQVLLS